MQTKQEQSIKEQAKPAPGKVDYGGLEYFFMKMNQGNLNAYQRWVHDPNNPIRRDKNLVITKEVIIPSNLVNKPLVWSLLVNGKKEPRAIFEIFKDDKGTIYYNCLSDTFALCQTDDGDSSYCKNATYQTLTSKNAQLAIDHFNGRVQFKKVTQ